MGRLEPSTLLVDGATTVNNVVLPGTREGVPTLQSGHPTHQFSTACLQMRIRKHMPHVHKSPFQEFRPGTDAEMLAHSSDGILGSGGINP